MHKFRNKPKGGYASTKEYNRALALRLMQHAGQIKDLTEQQRWILIPKQDGERACEYRSDFTYREWPDWNLVVEDCKGMRTPAYVIKRKLMLMVHRIKIRET